MQCSQEGYTKSESYYGSVATFVHDEKRQSGPLVSLVEVGLIPFLSPIVIGLESVVINNTH